EAAVIGGRERWARRLQGLLAKRELAIAAAEDATEAEALARRRDELMRLRDFAMPIVDALAGLPRAASWAEWLDALRALAGRARSGRLPTADELAGEAEREGGAHLAWPAPVDPGQAIDEAELDLAVVRAHLASPRRGIARYALDSNPTLAASLRLRYQRDTAK